MGWAYGNNSIGEYWESDEPENPERSDEANAKRRFGVDNPCDAKMDMEKIEMDIMNRIQYKE